MRRLLRSLDSGTLYTVCRQISIFIHATASHLPLSTNRRWSSAIMIENQFCYPQAHLLWFKPLGDELWQGETTLSDLLCSFLGDIYHVHHWSMSQVTKVVHKLLCWRNQDAKAWFNNMHMGVMCGRHECCSPCECEAGHVEQEPRWKSSMFSKYNVFCQFFQNASRAFWQTP